MGMVSTRFSDIISRVTFDASRKAFVIGGIFVLRGRPNKNDNVDGRLWLQFRLKPSDNDGFQRIQKMLSTFGYLCAAFFLSVIEFRKFNCMQVPVMLY